MSIYYTVYQTTNSVNGKIYIGVHKTTDPDDDYLGSNRVLKAAIEKYGKEKFDKEVLYVFDNEEEMFTKERELVNEEFITRDDTYNIGLGGMGWTGLGQYIVDNKVGILSDDYIKNKKSEVSRSVQPKLRKEKLGIYGLTDEQRSEQGKKAAKTCEERGIGIFALTDEQRSENGRKGASTCKEKGVGLFGISFEERSEVSKRTIANMDPEVRREICSAGGKAGGAMGVKNKSGVHALSAEERSANGKKGNDKQKELGIGFYSKETQSELGKRGGPKNKGFIWYNDGVKTYKYTKKQQDQISFDEFLVANPEFSSGRLEREFKERPKAKGKKTLTNGITNIMLLEKEIDKFLAQNPDYRFGRTNFVNNKKKK